MSAPPLVPYFLDRELYPSLPDSAALTRRLIRFQRWARAQWARAAPSTCWPAATWGDALPYGKRVTSFYVPTPPVPTRRARLWLYRRGTGYFSYGTVYLVSRRTGNALAFGGAGGWTVHDAVFDAPDVIDVYAHSDDGLRGISAYWNPLAEPQSGVSFAPWSALSQAHPSAGTSDSAYMLRWLGRTANGLLAHRPMQIVAADAFGHDGAVGNVGIAGYVMRLTPGVSTIRVQAFIRSTVAGTVGFTLRRTEVDPSLSATAYTSSVPSDNLWRWYTVDIPVNFPAPATGILAAIAGTAGSLTTGNVKIGAISAWELDPTATGLGLPSGQVIPASYTALDERSIRSRSTIATDVRATLIRNMTWLAAKKTRLLVCDSARHALLRSGLAGSEPWYSTLGVYWFQNADDGVTRQMRVRGSALQTTLNGEMPGWSSWAPDNGQPGGAVWKTIAQDAPAASEPWFTHEAHQLAPAAGFVYRRSWLNYPSAPNPTVVTDGAVIESMPEGSPLTSWP